MDSPLQGYQRNDQPIQVSSPCLSVQHTNTSHLVVSIPRQGLTVGNASHVTIQSASRPHNLIVNIPRALLTLQKAKQLIVSIPRHIIQPSTVMPSQTISASD